MGSEKPKAIVYFLENDLLLELTDNTSNLRKVLGKEDFVKIKDQYNLDTEYHYFGFYSYEQDKPMVIYISLKILKSSDIAKRLRAYGEIWEKIEGPIYEYLGDYEAVSVLEQTLLGLFVAPRVSYYYPGN